MTSVEMLGVAVAYNGVRAVDGVSSTFPARAWLGLIGPNGAGKSTLLRAVAGLVPYSGVIRIGEDVAASLSRRRLSQMIAYLPQRPVIPAGLSVTDYVSIGRTPYIPYWGSESPRDRAVVMDVLERLELTALAGRHVGSLSGGEIQRAVLARALAQQAQVLLLDEPTSALDVGHQQQVLELIDELRSEQGLTVISALHDLTLAGQFADRLVLLSGGKVVTEGSAAAVLTEDRIREHYDATVRVVDRPETGITVVPVRSQRRTTVPVVTEALKPRPHS